MRVMEEVESDDLGGVDQIHESLGVFPILGAHRVRLRRIPRARGRLEEVVVAHDRVIGIVYKVGGIVHECGVQGVGRHFVSSGLL